MDNGLIKINVAGGLSDYDEDGVGKRGFSISGSGFDEFFPAYTKYECSKLNLIYR